MGSITHGGSQTRLYAIWGNMKQRCNNHRNHKYSSYGGRGILMCDDWESSFESFRNWSLANGYSDKLTIDRINNNGNYEPDNCRWTDVKTQNNNKRSNIIIDGISITMKCEELGLDASFITRRMTKDKLSFEEAINIPIGYNEYKIEYRGEVFTLKDICKVLALKYNTVTQRLTKLNWTLQRALESNEVKYTEEHYGKHSNEA